MNYDEMDTVALYDLLNKAEDGSLQYQKIAEVIKVRLLEDEGDRFLKSYLSEVASKPFMRNISRVQEGESLSDVELAKTLSSHLTHALIEMERRDEKVNGSLFISETASLLARFLGGEASPQEVVKFIKARFPSQAS
jgi:hypothetical protein